MKGETMRQLLGFWLTSEAIAIIIVIITGVDLDFIEIECYIIFLIQNNYKMI